MFALLNRYSFFLSILSCPFSLAMTFLENMRETHPKYYALVDPKNIGPHQFDPEDLIEAISDIREILETRNERRG